MAEVKVFNALDIELAQKPKTSSMRNVLTTVLLSKH